VYHVCVSPLPLSRGERGLLATASGVGPMDWIAGLYPPGSAFRPSGEPCAIPLSPRERGRGEGRQSTRPWSYPSTPGLAIPLPHGSPFPAMFAERLPESRHARPMSAAIKFPLLPASALLILSYQGELIRGPSPPDIPHTDAREDELTAERISRTIPLSPRERGGGEGRQSTCPVVKTAQPPTWGFRCLLPPGCPLTHPAALTGT